MCWCRSATCFVNLVIPLAELPNDFDPDAFQSIGAKLEADLQADKDVSRVLGGVEVLQSVGTLTMVALSR